MKKRTIAILLLAGIGAQASVIVQWGAVDGADVVAANDNMLKPGDTYSAGTVITGINYNGTDGAPTSPNFNAAVLPGAGALASSRILHDANGDGIAFYDAEFLNAMVVWEDFLTPDTTLENLSMSMRGQFAGNVAAAAYIIEKTDGEWYISNKVLSGIGTTYANHTAAAASMTWYDFDPMVGGVVGIGTAPVAIDMENVTSVGTYATCVEAGGNNGPVIRYFEATAVPEPATFGLVAILGGAVVYIRRKLTVRNS